MDLESVPPSLSFAVVSESLIPDCAWFGEGRHLSLLMEEVWQWEGLTVRSDDQKLSGDRVCEGVGQVWRVIRPSSRPTAKIYLCVCAWLE